MERVTAYVVIGVIEPDGFMPRNWAYLVEDERLEWFIAPSTWLSSPETLVDDLMLGVATVVEELPFLVADIPSVTDHEEGDVIDLGKLSGACRQKLIRLNRGVKHHVHLVVTILSDSLMNGQISEFVRYNVRVEVRTASYGQDGSMANFNRRGADRPPDSLHLN